MEFAINCLCCLLDREPSLQPSAVLPALVIGIVKSRGLQLQLPCHQVGDAHFTDLLDSYEDHPESKYRLNQFVRCCVVSELPGVRRKWAVSLRPSRFVAAVKNCPWNDFIRFCVQYVMACHCGFELAHSAKSNFSVQAVPRHTCSYGSELYSTKHQAIIINWLLLTHSQDLSLTSRVHYLPTPARLTLACLNFCTTQFCNNNNNKRDQCITYIEWNETDVLWCRLLAWIGWLIKCYRISQTLAVSVV